MYVPTRLASAGNSNSIMILVQIQSGNDETSLHQSALADEADQEMRSVTAKDTPNPMPRMLRTAAKHIWLLEPWLYRDGGAFGRTGWCST